MTIPALDSLLQNRVEGFSPQRGSKMRTSYDRLQGYPDAASGLQTSGDTNAEVLPAGTRNSDTDSAPPCCVPG
jgi:hypothetical protein